MQPDYNQASTFLLFEILKATASNGSQPSIPSSPTAFFSPSRSDEWLNSLWVVSLTLSLITALVAVLVKQWLHQYVAVVSDSSVRDCARIRHIRYAGLQTWRVPMIIGLLPVLLHVSLALFFAGLAIFLFSLGMKVAWLVSIIGAATYMAYIIAVILPLVYPYCPYKVPLTLYVHRLYQFFCAYLPARVAIVLHYLYTRVFRRNSPSSLPRYWQEWHKNSTHARPIFSTLKEIEHAHLQKHAMKVDAQSVQWLDSSTSNTSVHQSVLQAISGMTPDTLKCLPTEYVSTVAESLHQRIEHMKALESSSGAESGLAELEIYSRAFWLLRGHPMDGRSNELFEMVLSMTTTEKASVAFLRILQGRQQSSLTLHPAAWKILFNITIFSPSLCSSAMGLELELMKSLASPSTTSGSEDPTTIDNLTDEMRGYICDKLLARWGYDRTPTSCNRSITGNYRLGIMLSLIPRIHQRLLDSLNASDRKEVIETALAIINGIVLDIDDFFIGMETILDTLAGIFALLSSESEASDVNVEIFAHGISMIFNTDQSQWIQTISVVTRQRMLNMDSSLIDMGIDALVDITLLLIHRHRERILYMWVDRSTMHHWKEYVSRLIRWASGEQFRQWVFLKRVLAIVAIRELQRRLDCADVNESLPQYDYGVHREVDRLPWLLDIYSPGSSR